MADRPVIDDFDGEFRFLSKFWPDGPETNEHLYQAAKTDDPMWAARILAAPLPNDAKTLGRKCPARVNWDNERIPVMRALLRVKFSLGSFCGTSLLATGDAELIEGNWWGDTFWGVCKGKGTNHLGLLLMETREMLRYLEDLDPRAT